MKLYMFECTCRTFDKISSDWYFFSDQILFITVSILKGLFEFESLILHNCWQKPFLLIFVIDQLFWIPLSTTQGPWFPRVWGADLTQLLTESIFVDFVIDQIFCNPLSTTQISLESESLMLQLLTESIFVDLYSDHIFFIPLVHFRRSAWVWVTDLTTVDRSHSYWFL